MELASSQRRPEEIGRGLGDKETLHFCAVRWEEGGGDTERSFKSFMYLLRCCHVVQLIRCSSQAVETIVREILQPPASATCMRKVPAHLRRPRFAIRFRSLIFDSRGKGFGGPTDGGGWKAGKKWTVGGIDGWVGPKSAETRRARLANSTEYVSPVR